MLFALAIDPFLAMMQAVDAAGQSTTRACADDIGAAIANIARLLKF